MRKLINKIIVCFLLTCLVFNVEAQDNSRMVVITYEQTYSNKFQAPRRTFWIAYTDSISKYHLEMYPLLLSAYYKSDIDSCIKGRAFNPFLSDFSERNQLDTAYQNGLEDFKRVIHQKAVRLQIIKKTWNTRVETDKIYITPVVGNFCFSKFSKSAQSASDYDGLIFIATSKISYDQSFASSEKFKFISNFDFAAYNFTYNIVYNTFPEWERYRK